MTFGRKKDIAASGAQKQNTDTKLPLRFQWKEPEHEDEEHIEIKRLFAEVIPTWKGGSFDPNVMNAGTGRSFGKRHHVKGEAGKDKRDFENLTFGFCLEFIDQVHEGKVYRVRCLNQFTVHSQQCTEHPKAVCKDGPNKIYDILEAGRVATYGMIKDRKPAVIEAAMTPEQHKQKLLEEQESLSAKINETNERGEDATDLLAQLTEVKRALSGKAGDGQKYTTPTPATTSLPSYRSTIDAPIYSLRRSAKNSNPGIPRLDAKFKLMRNPNNLKTRAISGSKLQSVAEEDEGKDEEDKENKKGRKYKKPDSA